MSVSASRTALSSPVAHMDHALQVTLLKQQPSILIATPGRLLDLVDDEDCDLTLGKHISP